VKQLLATFPKKGERSRQRLTHLTIEKDGGKGFACGRFTWGMLAEVTFWGTGENPSFISRGEKGKS